MSAGVLLLSGCSSRSGAESAVPSSSPLITVSSDADYVTVFSACMEDKGWTVEITDDADGGHGVSVNYPQEQASQYQADAEECNSMFAAPEMDSEMASQAYERQKKISECLTAAGYSVPDLPSKETYISGMLDGTETYNVFSLVPDGDLGAAMRTCNVNG